jgi:hypothetical protein
MVGSRSIWLRTGSCWRSNGLVLEMVAPELAGAGPEETGNLVSEATRLANGGILMVSDAHAWDRLPEHGHQVLRRLYEVLSEYRLTLGDNLAVILAGEAEPSGRMLRGIPPLEARFRAVIGIPGYTPQELSPSSPRPRATGVIHPELETVISGWHGLAHRTTRTRTRSPGNSDSGRWRAGRFGPVATGRKQFVGGRSRCRGASRPSGCRS